MGKSIGISPERRDSSNLPHRCPDQPGTAKRERGTCSEDSNRSNENHLPATKTLASRMMVAKNRPLSALISNLEAVPLIAYQIVLDDSLKRHAIQAWYVP